MNQSFTECLQQYLDWLGAANYSPQTAIERKSQLKHFIAWCEERDIRTPQEVTRPILERYKQHLYHCRGKGDKPLSFRSQRSRLSAVRAIFKWLTKSNYLLYNPAAELELPKVNRRLPKHVLTKREAEEVLNQPTNCTAPGLRDRAILETFYSSGIRRGELISLQIYDIDRERRTICVRQGKGNKDRMIPIGERAIMWIDKYLEESRPQLVVPPEHPTLFLNNRGMPFDGSRMSNLVRDYVAQANIGKEGACHIFRHTMATLMLENGADVRYIQQMLGHAELSTTQIYTQVSIRALQEVFARTHPGAQLKPEAPPEQAEEPQDPKQELLATLEAEAEED